MDTDVWDHAGKNQVKGAVVGGAIRADDSGAIQGHDHAKALKCDIMKERIDPSLCKC
jgi:hypothetical protein